MTDDQVLVSLNRLQEEAQAALEELANLKDDMYYQSKLEERSKVFKFIEDTKRAGFTELSKMDEYIQRRFNIQKSTAESYLFDYIERASPTVQITCESTSVISSDTISEQVKKRKGPKPYSEMSPEELAATKAKKMEKLQMAKAVEASTDQILATPLATPLARPEDLPVVKRVIKAKKTSDGIQVWNSFLKIVKAEMEASGVEVKYDDVVKRAREMKESDKEAYQLFSSTWTPEDSQVSSSSSL